MKLSWVIIAASIALIGCRSAEKSKAPVASGKVAVKSEPSGANAQTNPQTAQPMGTATVPGVKAPVFDPNEDPTPNAEYKYKNTQLADQAPSTVNNFLSVLNKISGFGVLIGLSPAVLNQLQTIAGANADQSTTLGKLLQVLNSEKTDNPVGALAITAMKKLLLGELTPDNAINSIQEKLKEATPLGGVLGGLGGLLP